MAFPKYSGAGSPQGVQVGTVGEYYENLTNGDLYQKVSGVGTNTGWQGPFRIAANGDVAAADVATTVPCDGALHNVSCITAAPPSWMDNAGHITAGGMYELIAGFNPGVAPTTPGLLIASTGQTGVHVIPLDGLALLDGDSVALVTSLVTADTPGGTQCGVQAPTDVTGTFTVQVAVKRLGFYVP